MNAGILILLAFLSNLQVLAAIDSLSAEARAMVPKGKVLSQNFREVTVKTESGTKVKVEFDRKGPLQEASGLNLNRGDEFEPGAGLVSLSSAARALARAGHEVRGEWTLEKDSQYGWVYEFSREAADKKIVYLVNARNGKLITSIDVPLLHDDSGQASGPPGRPGARQ